MKIPSGMEAAPPHKLLTLLTLPPLLTLHSLFVWLTLLTLPIHFSLITLVTLVTLLARLHCLNMFFCTSEQSGNELDLTGLPLRVSRQKSTSGARNFGKP